MLCSYWKILFWWPRIVSVWENISILPSIKLLKTIHVIDVRSFKKALWFIWMVPPQLRNYEHASSDNKKRMRFLTPPTEGDMKSITATSISASLQQPKTTLSLSPSSLQPGVSTKTIFSGREQRWRGQFTCITLWLSMLSFFLSAGFDILLKRAFTSLLLIWSESGFSQPFLTTLHFSSAVGRTWI